MKKLIMLAFISSIFSFGCNKNTEKDFKIAEESEIYGIATPIRLNIDETVVYLADFFTDVSKIDSIRCDKNISFQHTDDFAKITLKIVSDSLPKLSILNVFADGYKYSLLLKKSTKIKQEFIFDPHGTTYQKVGLMGEMNAWNSENTQLIFDKGVWTTVIEAEPGNYQYLLVIDDKQQLDPNNSESISNNMGGFNSVLKIGNADDSKIPYIFTEKFSDDSIEIAFENKIQKVIVFYQNHQLPQCYISKNKNNYKIKIPEQNTNLKRSYIRIWAYNKFGVSNDIKIPLDYGKVLQNTDSLTRLDYEAAVIYNVFIDRFFDGDATNNRPLNRTDVLPQADYLGGDITGVVKKVNDGYFNELSVNTLWISPIVKNVEGAYGEWQNPKTKFSAYHGYWPISFTEIDDRYGTEAEFKGLVELLHSNNQNIILDFVAHHVHEESPFYKKHPDWTTDLYLPDGTLNTERWDDHRLTTWFDVFLPTLDLAIPEVSDIISDSAVWWFEYYGIDGFRHDAAKHVPLSFWRDLRTKTKRQIAIVENRTLYQIGETYGTPELISSYINSGMLDAQFDFNLYDAISTALAAGNSFKNVANTLNTSFKYYGNHNLMGNITGNQDRGRFISYAGGTLRYDEDAKVAGWTRSVEVGDFVAYKKSALLFAFINTVPGIPIIYYGDEIGMPGGNDPDNRRMMEFDNLSDAQILLKQTVEKLIKLRRNSMPLVFGDFKFLIVEDEIMVYQRSYFGKIAVVVLNNSDETKNVFIPLNKIFDFTNLESKFGSCFSISNNELQIELEANSFEVLIN